MIIQPDRYTSGRIAIANLSATVASLQSRRLTAGFDDLAALSDLLFLRGDLLGRICDHDEAECVARDAIAKNPADAKALLLNARIANRFHGFKEASALLLQALVAGSSTRAVDAEVASVLQATGHYGEALALRERLAKEDPGMHQFGAMATLLAEMGRWGEAQDCYQRALNADTGVSPIPAAQLLFEWGVSAMRRGDLDRAEALFSALERLLPGHVPGRGHRAEVALARGELDRAVALVAPLLEFSDDPEYRATYAEILAARGDPMASIEARRAGAAYEKLLARRPAAYADHAAAFFLGVGEDPQRAADLAFANWQLRDTPRSRKLLSKARQQIQARSLKKARAA